MKSLLKALCFLFVLSGAARCFALDREAFSITSYDLDLQIEPSQHRLGARGKITLRNDSATPQKIAVLQISSSLDWRSIKAGEKAVQFVRQPYTSDIDHTGALSEAIVTLPQEVSPQGRIDLDIGYEGVILVDATRLTRIDTPDEVARNSDWDRIDSQFTGVRGAGYVAWYPIATAVANLSDADNLSEVLGRWKMREAGAEMRIRVTLPTNEPPVPHLIVGGMSCTSPLAESTSEMNQQVIRECMSHTLQLDSPTLLIADYQILKQPRFEVYYTASHNVAADNFAESAKLAVPVVTEWFGNAREVTKIIDLPDAEGTPFESGALLVVPLAAADPKVSGFIATHQLTHASFLSFRPWIEEGLAHFAQAVYMEQQKGRQAALDYMAAHRTVLNQVEAKDAASDSGQQADRALVSTLNDQIYRSKAMCVWWMLRDMVGDSALKKAVASYKPEEDKDPTYMQRLIGAQTQRDVGWFFDDWVYHDRGLPDFKVESAFAAKTPSNGFMLTITLDNLGTAGAEVPVLIRFAKGEMSKRIEVRASSKTTVRVETAAAPEEIRVNDGSVPERNAANNVFKVEPPK